MKNVYLIISFLLAGLIIQANQLFGQDHTPGKRPMIGLVLSGGGAKGFAHIGAIKVFEEAGLQFDYVGGTSMGSIIGGLYALGYHPDTMRKIVDEQDWNHVMADKVPRRYIPIEEKANADRFIVTFPVKKRRLLMKQGLYSGQLTQMLLAYYTSPAYKYEYFKDLPIPFLCIGTDLVDGSSVLLDRGVVHKAMRASMSIPSFFTPVVFNNHLLVDGGVVNNYPVKEVKDMGADIIVGVDVQSGLHHEDQLTSLVTIMDQITSFYRMDANKEGKAETNIYIHPDIGPYDMMSFAASDTIISLGEIAARKSLPQILRLVDSVNAIGAKEPRELNARPLDSVFVNSIQYKGLKNVSKSFLDGALEISPMSWLNLIEFHDGLTKAYASGFFESLDYTLVPDHDGVVLVVDVKEASSGILGAGIHYDSDYKVGLLLNGTFKNVLYKGSKLFVDLNLGENPRLTGFYLIDRGRKPGLGLRATIFSLKFNDYYKGSIIDAYAVTQNKLEIFTQVSNRKTVQFRTGIEYENIQIKSGFNPDIESEFNSYLTLFVNWKADTYDRSSFSTSGLQFNIKGKYILPLTNNWTDNFFSNAAMFQMRFRNNIPLSQNSTLKPGLDAGFTIRDNIPPPQHWFILGGQSENDYFDGFTPFSGIRFIEEAGLYMLIGRLDWQYNVYKKFYITLNMDAGYFDSDFDIMLKNPEIYVGCGITLGYDSFIGPIELSLMGSNHNAGVTSFLNIGYWF